MSAVATIIRAATRKENEPFCVLSFPTHERYQSGLSETNANYWMWQGEHIKEWKHEYAKVPKNHYFLDKSKGNNQIPLWLDFDCILSQHKFGQLQISKQIGRQLQLPIISLEHTLPMPNWPKSRLQQLKDLRGDINLFISEYSRAAWGWEETEAEIVHHGVDTEFWKPDENIEREKVVLSVVNDWINRGHICGFDIWQEVTKGLPVFPVGDTPNLSKPAKSTEQLREFYRRCGVFLNTSRISPIPSVVLEAMSNSCAVVSTDNCMLPEIIKNGENGFITNDKKKMREYLELLLNDKDLAYKIGQAARATIVEKFGLNKFVNRWNEIIKRASNITWTGE